MTDILDEIGSYLMTQQVLTLATVGRAGVWCCSVYFGYSNGKFFFTSKKDTRHAQDIGDGTMVAFAIADSSQTPSIHYTVGVQGVGYCRVANLLDIPDFIAHYGLKFSEYRELYGVKTKLEKAIRDGVSRAYVIEAKQIKYLNEKTIKGKRILIDFENTQTYNWEK